MKKFAGLIGVVMVFAAAGAFAAETTPVKVSLFPKVGIPAAQTVQGLDLGLIASKIDNLEGLQLSWLYSGVREKVEGVQMGFITRSEKDMTGVQFGTITSAEKVTGVQWGFVNAAADVTGLQVGFVNYTRNMKGVQVGLVNVITKGVLPAMVFVNANF